MIKALFVIPGIITTLVVSLCFNRTADLISDRVFYFIFGYFSCLFLSWVIDGEREAGG